MSKKAAIVILVGLLVANVLVVQTLAWRSDVYQQIDLLVDVRREIVTEYVDVPDEDKLVDSAVRAMVKSLGDPYTTYLAPEEMAEFDKQVRGQFSGIGAEIDIHENFLRIVNPLEDSPAWNKGVRAGDIVLEIEGKTTEGITTATAIKRLTGKAGTDVHIKVRHLNGDIKKITITRAAIKVPTVKGFSRNDDNSWTYMIDQKNKVGYIRLAQFTGESYPRLLAAVEQLKGKGVKGLILDLRFNPGGLLNSAVQISDMFLEGDKNIVSVKGRSQRDRSFGSTDDGAFKEAPLVVLINESSASASEIVSGALRDNDRAKIIGTRSFGKGSVQQVKMLEANGGALKITNALYYLPSGRNIHKRNGQQTWGVDPSEGYYVPMDYDQLTDMLKIRREKSIKGEDVEKGITPTFVKDTLKDLQLSAALQTIVAKIKTDKWEQVGKKGGAQIANQEELGRLNKLRTALNTRLGEIDKQIADFEAGNTPDAKKEDDKQSDKDAKESNKEEKKPE